MDSASQRGPPATQLPPWETPHSHRPRDGKSRHWHRTSTKSRFINWFDKHLPPHRTYLTLTRRAFLLALLALFLLLALTIGLAAGLTRRSK